MNEERIDPFARRAPEELFRFHLRARLREYCSVAGVAVDEEAESEFLHRGEIAEHIPFLDTAGHCRLKNGWLGSALTIAVLQFVLFRIPEFTQEYDSRYSFLPFDSLANDFDVFAVIATTHVAALRLFRKVAVDVGAHVLSTQDFAVMVRGSKTTPYLPERWDRGRARERPSRRLGPGGRPYTEVITARRGGNTNGMAGGG